MPRQSSESASLRRKPWLFCDVDGVISLWNWDSDTRPPGRWSLIDGIPHFLSTCAAEHLLSLCGPFDPVWCTGWEERADDHLPRLLGLPSGWPHLSFDGRSRAEVSASAHWKLAAIDAHAGDRPLAWIDDAFNDACHAWAAARPQPTLLVTTDPARGLDDAAAAELTRWARELEER